MKTREKLKNLGKRMIASVMAFSMCLTLVPETSVFTVVEEKTELSSVFRQSDISDLS